MKNIYIYQFDEFYKSKKENSSETKTEIPEVDKKEEEAAYFSMQRQEKNV